MPRRLANSALALIQVIAVSCGGPASQEVLRNALARGADRAIHVSSEDNIEPLAVAKVLKAVAEKNKVDLVLLGKQAIDDDSAQTAPMTAALLNWPQVRLLFWFSFSDGGIRVSLRPSWTTARRPRSSPSSARLTAASRRSTCRRPPSCRPISASTCPASPTSRTSWCESYFFSLAAADLAALLQKAKKRPIEAETPESLGVTVDSRLKVVKVAEPPKRTGGGKVANVDELIAKLKAAGTL